MLRLLLLLLTISLHQVAAINSNELKPCFERYDGFKIIDTMPFHSEWRMKTEDQCLEFCVRSSSRCVSIVYDKYSHICHYFNVNAIENELIVKSPRMVYFQTAEKECIEAKVNKIIREEVQKRIAMEEIQKLRPKNTSSPTPEPSPTDPSAPGEPAEEETVAPPAPIKEDPIPVDESILGLDNDFDGDPMNFVKVADDEDKQKSPMDKKVDGSVHHQPRRIKEDAVVARFVDHPPEEMTSPTTSATTTPEPTTSTTTTTTSTTTTTTPPTTTTTTTTSTTTTTTTSTTPPTTTRRITTSTAKVFKEIVRPVTSSAAPIDQFADGAPMMPQMEPMESMIPVMSGFRMNRKSLPDMVPESQDKKSDVEVEVRRHPGRKRPLAAAFDEEEIPRKLSLYEQNCLIDHEQVWIAVENSQVDSGTRSSILKLAAKPSDCQETCQKLQVGGSACDSFTFMETSKRCIFYSSPQAFAVKAAANNDFSTRAFRRFCFPASLAPFADCAEFLAFRDYALDIEPKEVFEGLPPSNDGISACVELCVLAQDFRCKSATFDQNSGICMLYDEHSLSKPSAFKEHQLANQLYFENGCLPAQIPIEDVKAYAKTERIVPKSLDFRKIAH